MVIGEQPRQAQRSCPHEVLKASVRLGPPSDRSRVISRKERFVMGRQPRDLLAKIDVVVFESCFHPPRCSFAPP